MIALGVLWVAALGLAWTCWLLFKSDLEPEQRSMWDWLEEQER